MRNHHLDGSNRITDNFTGNNHALSFPLTWNTPGEGKKLSRYDLAHIEIEDRTDRIYEKVDRTSGWLRRHESWRRDPIKWNIGSSKRKKIWMRGLTFFRIRNKSILFFSLKRKKNEIFHKSLRCKFSSMNYQRGPSSARFTVTSQNYDQFVPIQNKVHELTDTWDVTAVSILHYRTKSHFSTSQTKIKNVKVWIMRLNLNPWTGVFKIPQMIKNFL